MPCRSPGPHFQGEVEGSGLGGVSRPTPRGEVEGSGLGGLQVHNWVGVISRPTPRVVSQHALRQTPLQQTATAAGSTHPTGMHSC